MLDMGDETVHAFVAEVQRRIREASIPELKEANEAVGDSGSDNESRRESSGMTSPSASADPLPGKLVEST